MCCLLDSVQSTNLCASRTGRSRLLRSIQAEGSNFLIDFGGSTRVHNGIGSKSGNRRRGVGDNWSGVVVATETTISLLDANTALELILLDEARDTTNVDGTGIDLEVSGGRTEPGLQNLDCNKKSKPQQDFG